MTGPQGYTGYWVDYSQDGALGATITVRSQSGAILIAFLTTLVTLAGSSIWTIFAFGKHRQRSDKENHDLAFYQEQIVLRNPSHPLSSSWQLYKVRKKWSEGFKERHGFSRLIFLAPLIIFIASMVASILVAQVATKNYNASSLRLSSGACGFPHADPSNRMSIQAFSNKLANDSRTASSYVDNCYNGPKGALGCTTLPVQNLRHTTSFQADCPFQGLNRCLLGGKGAMQLDTGYLDSNYDFGINAPPSERIKYRRLTTCAPLRAKDRVKTSPDPTSIVEEFIRVQFDFGPVFNQATGLVSNFTYTYFTRSANTSIGYTLTSVYAAAGDLSPAWAPIKDLDLPDADVSLHFLASNSVRYLTPVFDPLFSANGTWMEPGVIDENLYVPDQWVNVIGCADQYQICKSTSSGDSCTALGGVLQSLDAFDQLGPEPAQYATVARMQIASVTTGIYNIISGQNGNAIQATKKLVNFFSPGLPDDQWQLEVIHWFRTGLASMQQRIVDFVDNTWASDPSLPLTVLHPDALTNTSVERRTALRNQCGQQRVQSTASYQSFSFLGFIIIVVIAPILMILSWTLDSCINVFDKKPTSQNHHRYVAYQANEKQQILRMALENGGYDNWQDCMEDIPCRDKAAGLVGPPSEEQDDNGKAVKVTYLAEQELRPILNDSDSE